MRFSRFMRIFIGILLLTNVYLAVAELFSLVAGGLVIAGGGLLYSAKHRIQCKLYECCDVPYVNPNFNKLRNLLNNELYGQHLVTETVYNSVVGHWNNPSPDKPLVLAFHGPTGSGKNHVAKMIVESLFQKGMKSAYVTLHVSTVDFEFQDPLEIQLKHLREKLLTAVKKCARSIFIFDEVDKLDPAYMRTIKPFLDHYESVAGQDFRKAIFILLSNKGGNSISTMTSDHFLAGKRREDLTLMDFQKDIRIDAFEQDGGLNNAEVITSFLIDHFVPFLPLERKHVLLCARDYLRGRDFKKESEDAQFLELIISNLQFFPEDERVFSNSGCKQVGKKAELLVAKLRPPAASEKTHIFDDDL